MKKSRKDIQALLSSVKVLRDKHQYLCEDIVNFSSEAEYTKTIKYYDKLIASITDKLRTLPIGYKYTGVFYLKKPFCVVPEFQECDGELFMREDLVSWQVTKGVGLANQFYYKAAFKQPSEKSAITREDAVPVYAKATESEKAAT